MFTGKDLLSLRRDLQLDQRQFGEWLGLSAQRISQLEGMRDSSLPDDLAERMERLRRDGVVAAGLPNPFPAGTAGWDPVDVTFRRIRWQPNGTKTFILTGTTLLEAIGHEAAGSLVYSILNQPESEWFYLYPSEKAWDMDNLPAGFPSPKRNIQDAYAEVRRRLTEYGVPESSIAGIHEPLPVDSGLYFHPICKTVLTVYPIEASTYSKTWEDIALVEIPSAAEDIRSHHYHLDQKETAQLTEWLARNKVDVRAKRVSATKERRVEKP